MKKALFMVVLFLFSHRVWASNAQDYYKAGINLYQQKQYSQAVTYLKAATQLDSQFWQAYQALGTAYYQMGDKTNAYTAIHQSLKIHPDNPSLEKFEATLAPAKDAVPLSAKGMSVKPITSPGSKSQNIFFNVGLSYELPFGNVVDKMEKNFNAQSTPSGSYAENYYTPQIMYFCFELGYELDKENGLSLCAGAPTANTGPGLQAGYRQPYPSENGNYLDIYGTQNTWGLRYTRYLPDSWGRWMGFVEGDYYTLQVIYGSSYTTGTYPSYNGAAMGGTLNGTTIGANLGIGRQLDIFGFLSLEATVSVKLADVSKVTGPYTSTTTTSGSTSPGPSGQGTLVTLSNGSAVLVDQNNVGSSKVTDFDLSGLEGRAVLNFWF